MLSGLNKKYCNFVFETFWSHANNLCQDIPQYNYNILQYANIKFEKNHLQLVQAKRAENSSINGKPVSIRVNIKFFLHGWYSSFFGR